MTEREYDFWRGWNKAVEQHGASYDFHCGGEAIKHHVDPDFSDGYISACQYWDMPVVDQEEAQGERHQGETHFV